MTEKIKDHQASEVKSSGTSQLLPNAYGVLRGFKAIGYSLPEALSDLIDNSIDAKAKNVVIQFGRTNDELKFIQVIDDGEGITPDHIDNAMGWGYESKKTDSSLGCFGLGMKTASFAIADSLTVFSRAKGKTPVGRRWTDKNITEKDWTIEKIDKKIVEAWLSRDFGEIDISKQGTLVQLDNVQEFNIGAGQVAETLGTISKDLDFHIGLHFHRFIESNKLNVFLTSLNIENGNSLGYSKIQPLNPMPMKSGNKEYPKTYTLDMEGIGKLNLEAYVWPKNSKNPEYKMNGTAATSQGFYWYRNDRLINQDGWNRLRDTEPHYSLARATIDLPPKYDSIFGLQVGKYKVEPPKLFLNNVFDKSFSKDNNALREWIRDAEETYRRKPESAESNVTFVPSTGFGNKALQKKYFNIFSNGSEEIIPVTCNEKDMDSDKFFAIDIDKYEITFNKQYLKRITKEKSIGTLKLSIFLLVRNYFFFSTLKKNHLIEIDELNKSLLQSVSA